ncbi:tripartite tricarboxylate transporter substrate binding protein [Ramlibacter sp. PS3R-8]|uniref:Bug family tripartite tricarboxylate transporter substrate binding protein n=1 Tax=Ramlibacter sp. PS3R-8 TaxID=3133437 RepID=UPI003099DC00
MKKLIEIALGLMVIAGAVLPAHAQSPAKPITLMIPFTAGGATDVIGRTLAQSLSETLKQTVIAENVPGAGGTIAGRRLLESPPDGSTLYMASPSQLVLAGLVNRELKMKAEDFRPIHMIGTLPYVIMARSDLPVRTADELAVLAREAARKGMPLTYASVGAGTLNHLLGEELARRIKAPLVHVPYKGGAEVMRDLIGARVDIFINIYTAQQIALAQEGRFKFLAALSAARQPLLPQVQTVDEGNVLKGWHTEVWSGLFVRTDTPEPVVQNLNKAMARVLSDEKVRKFLLDQAGLRAATPRTSTADVDKEYAAGVEEFRTLGRNAGFN